MQRDRRPKRGRRQRWKIIRQERPHVGIYRCWTTALRIISRMAVEYTYYVIIKRMMPFNISSQHTRFIFASPSCPQNFTVFSTKAWNIVSEINIAKAHPPALEITT